MKISVRFEGGLGDHLLANRLVPGILARNPGAEIHMFSDTGGNTLQSDTLLDLYDFYSSSTLLKRKSDEHYITTQFGKENFTGHLDNVDDEQKKEMLSFDKFYNLHIDWLEWIDYDIGWQQHFYHFPLPSRKIVPFPHKKPYIVMHIASDNLGNNHRMSKEYIERVIDGVDKRHDIFMLSTTSTNEFVSSRTPDSDRIKKFQAPLREVIRLIKGCEAILAIDSGIKYFGFTFNKPTLCWAQESSRPHTCPYASQLRWLVFPQLMFPLEHDPAYMNECMENLIRTNNFFIGPQIKGKNLKGALIKREEQ
jgi:ADP-heptose:LPS heptosyltransferase